MEENKEVAQLMFKLAYAKSNWGAKYDRLEHFKRFSNLKGILKFLKKKKWLLIKKKPTYIGISLNPFFKKDIINFIEDHLNLRRE